MATDNLKLKILSLEKEICGVNFNKMPLHIQTKKKDQLEYMRTELAQDESKKEELQLITIEETNETYIFSFGTKFFSGNNEFYVVLKKYTEYKSFVIGLFQLYKEQNCNKQLYSADWFNEVYEACTPEAQIQHYLTSYPKYN